MTKFTCEECNYCFEKDAKFSPKKYPYCGAQSITKQKNTQDLIDKI